MQQFSKIREFINDTLDSMSERQMGEIVVPFLINQGNPKRSKPTIPTPADFTKKETESFFTKWPSMMGTIDDKIYTFIDLPNGPIISGYQRVDYFYICGMTLVNQTSDPRPNSGERLAEHIETIRRSPDHKHCPIVVIAENNLGYVDVDFMVDHIKERTPLTSVHFASDHVLRNGVKMTSAIKNRLTPNAKQELPNVIIEYPIIPSVHHKVSILKIQMCVSHDDDDESLYGALKRLLYWKNNV